MVANLTPTTPTYVKVGNFPGLYRHARSGLYYGCKKLKGKRRERSLGTCDRKIAERRLKEWIGDLDKVDLEVEKTTLLQLLGRFRAVTGGLSESSRATNESVIKRFLTWWPYGKDVQVRQVRPSMLDEWLAHEEPRLRNVSYNGYAAFIRQLFNIAVGDRIIAESPAKTLRVPWKKPQTPQRLIPTLAQFEAIIDDVRAEPTGRAKLPGKGADFLEFLGRAGVGQAEAASLTWGDVDWTRNRIMFRRHKTDTHFNVPIYNQLRPLLLRLKAATRGKASDKTRVFKIEDAKKALCAACKRLDFPPFSQRSLRQGLISRLRRAQIDVKLIAKWQGHSDGGQLIMETYTEGFSDDDDEYERSQLAKLTGRAQVASEAAPFAADTPASATSEAMKRPTKRDALPTPDPTPDPTPANPPAPAVNPFQKGDKVKTQCKGEEVEAEVTAVYKDEVQVKTPDGERRWRTIRTVQQLALPPAPAQPTDSAEATPVKRKRGVKMRSKPGSKK